MSKIIYDFEQMESLYNRLVDGCDFKNDMAKLLNNTIEENEHRISELMLLQKDFCTPGKTNTRTSYRINKLRWANDKKRKLLFNNQPTHNELNHPLPNTTTPKV